MRTIPFRDPFSRLGFALLVVIVFPGCLEQPVVKESLRSVTPTLDSVVPSSVITAPSDNASVSGSVSLTASASDNVHVVGVQFKLDGVNVGAEDLTSPFSISWDTTATTDGSHSLVAVARDTAGNTKTSTAVTVTVANADATAPTVSVTAPAANANISGTVAVTATATDNIGVVGVQFKLDGVNLGAEDLASPFSISWDTTTSIDGSYTLTAVARDAAGNSTTSASVTVNVNNSDAVAPVVSITTPKNNAHVSARTIVTATATDNVGVVGVRFKLDGANIAAEDLTSPYAITWDSSTTTDGNHTLTAVARDAAGNSTTSAAITVTVNNVAGTPGNGTWTQICDNPTGNCPVGANWSGVRGYMNVLPYDNHNQELIYLGAGLTDSSIYSNAYWGYVPTKSGVAGHMVLRIDSGVPGDQSRNDCPNYVGGSPLASALTGKPLAGHPLGNAAFDMSRNSLYTGGWLCNSQYEPKTHIYNSVTGLMETDIDGYEYSPACVWSNVAPYECNPGRNFQTWVYMGTAPSGNAIDKVLVGLSDGNSGRRMVEFDPSTQTYCVIGTTCAGSDVTGSTGLPCTGATCPPALMTSYGLVYNDTDNYVYVFGGCNGTSPGNTAPNLCNGSNQNDLWQYDGELRRFYKVSPVGGVKPPATNTSSPFFAYDGRRNRMLLYLDTNTIWQYDVGTNTWSTITSANSGPTYSAYMGNHCDANVAGYDPISDVFVIMHGDTSGQSNSPSIWELNFGGGP